MSTAEKYTIDKDREKELIDRFLDDNVLFLGPDPEIMENHDISPRTERENTAMKNESDPAVLALVRDRLQAGCNETFEMLEQMGAAPGAKWGDIITGVFTPSGDLAVGSTGGVLLFACLVHHPSSSSESTGKASPRSASAKATVSSTTMRVTGISTIPIRA